MTTQILIVGGVLVWMVGAVFSLRLVRKVRARKRAAGQPVSEVNPLAAVGMLGVIAFAFAVVVGPGMLAERRHRELVETGTPATAMITAVEETGNVYNHQAEVELTLEVEPADGESFESSATWIFSVADIQTYRVGTRVDVFFDPADTEVAAVVKPTGAS